MKKPKSPTKFKMTPARYYNHLIDQGDRLLKSSIHYEKIKAEIKYYQELGPELSRYHPAFLGESSGGQWETGYLIEKIPACDFGQVFSGLCRSEVSVEDLLAMLKDYLGKVPTKTLGQAQWSEKLERQVLLKNERRLRSLRGQSYFSEVEKVFKQNGWGSIDSFMNALNKSIREQSKNNQSLSVWRSHGDLCFSNIIPYSNKIFLVDPRGITSEEDGLLFPNYDLAKISQCLLGGYDFINNEVAFAPELVIKGPLVDIFKEFVGSFKQSYELTRLFEVSHFFSMLPLHISSPKKVLSFSRTAVKLYEALR